MDTKTVFVEVRIGKYDFVHLPESQTCVHIAHPLLDEPLDLLLAEYHAEEFHNCCWDEIVERALGIWLAQTRMSKDRPRAAEFKELFDGSEEIRVHFRQAYAADRLARCQIEMDRLQREMAKLRNYLAARDPPAKRIPNPTAA